ncbi:hypothetical protein Tco_1567848, partial [Tanacetum coccineum]
GHVKHGDTFEPVEIKVYVLLAVREEKKGHSAHGELEQGCSAAPLLARDIKTKGVRLAKVKFKGAICW